MTDHIFTAVMDAMQQAEELHGPPASEYIILMERIAANASKRADIVREKLKEVKANGRKPKGGNHDIARRGF